MRRVLAAVLLIWLVSVSYGATAPEHVPEHSLAIVKLESDERANVVSQDFTPVDVYAGSDGICFTGKPGRYLVVVMKSGEPLPSEPRLLQMLIVTIGGRPTPPVPPGPIPPIPPVPEPLTGLAKEVFEKAVAVDDKENVKKLGAVFRNCVPQIGTTHTTLAQVYAVIRDGTKALALPAAKWSTFNAWLSAELTKRAQTLDTARTTFDAIATGLEAAAL